MSIEFSPLYLTSKFFQSNDPSANKPSCKAHLNVFPRKREGEKFSQVFNGVTTAQFLQPKLNELHFFSSTFKNQVTQKRVFFRTEKRVILKSQFPENGAGAENIPGPFPASKAAGFQKTEIGLTDDDRIVKTGNRPHA